jgi:hypothetical protein
MAQGDSLDENAWIQGVDLSPSPEFARPSWAIFDIKSHGPAYLLRDGGFPRSASPHFCCQAGARVWLFGWKFSVLSECTALGVPLSPYSIGPLTLDIWFNYLQPEIHQQQQQDESTTELTNLAQAGCSLRPDAPAAGNGSRPKNSFEVQILDIRGRSPDFRRQEGGLLLVLNNNIPI